jgi:hypothetical protein
MITREPKISRRIAASVLPALALVLGLAMALAACGSSSTGKAVANLGSGTAAASSVSSAGGGSKSGFQQALKFSACMRAHGITGFPDPVQHAGGGVSLTVRGGPRSGLDPKSPQFQAAQAACRKFAPGGSPGGTVSPAARAQALRFSACMRSHGVPGFPDPQFSGGGIRIQAAGGIDPSSPQFQSAQRACQADLPGAPGGGLSTQSGR